MARRLLLATLTATVGCAPVAEEAPPPQGNALQARGQQLYVAANRIWPTNSIPVCWDDDGHEEEKRWARMAFEDTWAVEGNIRFTGWGPCNANTNAGLRMVMMPAGGYVLGLGTELNNVTAGVNLNSWEGADCGLGGRERCVRATAVHEFGHALGFAHEQNRQDTPAGSPCAPQGTNGTEAFGAWDLYSVLNYCNPVFCGDGELSEVDGAGVAQYYGERNLGGARQSFARIDINGDERGDLLTRNAHGTFDVWLSNGATLVYSGSFTTPYTDENNWNQGHRFFVADVNGDQSDDLLARHSDGMFAVWLSNGSTLAYSTSFTTPYTDTSGWNEGHRFFVMDINADLRDDLLARSAAGNFTVWLSNGSTLAYSAYFTTSYSDASGWNQGHRFFVADIDGLGDSRPELIARSAAGRFSVWRAKGPVLVFSHEFTTKLDNARGWDEGHRFLIMDMNGDQKDDLVTRWSSGAFSVWYSDGRKFVESSTRYDLGFNNGQGWKFGHRFFPMDIDKDGRDDLLARFPSGDLGIWSHGSFDFFYSGTIKTQYSDAAGWNDGNRFY